MQQKIKKPENVDNRIEAVIFDVDGVLIDAEPFWRAAEKEVFGSLGIAVTQE